MKDTTTKTRRHEGTKTRNHEARSKRIDRRTIETRRRFCAQEINEAGEAAVAETIDCGFTVHRTVGPGYLEPVYRHAMCVELAARGVPFERERVFTVRYREATVGLHRLDLVVRGSVASS